MPNNISELITANDFPELFNTYLREITAYIFNNLHDEEETLQLVSDVFYTVCVDVNKNKVYGDNLRACLYKISRDLCLEKTSRKEISRINYKNNIKDDDSTNEQLIDSIILEDINLYLENSFSELELTVFKLKYHYSLNIQEIAEVIDSSAPTVIKILKNTAKEIDDEFHDIL